MFKGDNLLTSHLKFVGTVVNQQVEPEQRVLIWMAASTERITSRRTAEKEADFDIENFKGHRDLTLFSKNHFPNIF